MTRNVGPADRAVRIVLGGVLAFIIAMGLVESWFAVVLGAFATLLLLTGLAGRCPFYRMMDIDSQNHEDAYVRVDEGI